MNDIREVRPYNKSDLGALVELYKDKSSYGGNYDPERDTEERLQSVSDELLVAEKLLDMAAGIARQRGHESIIVYTDNESEKLIDRYSQLGFNKGDTYEI